MKIQSLIDKLSSYPLDYELYLFNSDENYYFNFVKIEEDKDNKSIEIILE